MQAHGGKLRLRRLPAHLLVYLCVGIRVARLKFTTHKSLAAQANTAIYLLDNLLLSGRKIKMHALLPARGAPEKEKIIFCVLSGVTSRTVNFKCKYVASKLMRRAESQTIFGFFPLVLSLHCFRVR